MSERIEVMARELREHVFVGDHELAEHLDAALRRWEDERRMDAADAISARATRSERNHTHGSQRDLLLAGAALSVFRGEKEPDDE